jgi:hypothetical protein
MVVGSLASTIIVMDENNKINPIMKGIEGRMEPRNAFVTIDHLFIARMLFFSMRIVRYH